jgi:hypothetical protein
MEEENRKFFDENPKYELPYPHLDNRQFQKKISFKKEFQYRYDGEIEDVSKQSEIVCKKKSRELFPHQEFIKRYISNDTPYNGMLLYHGLGSGKTCSAIGVTEALRVYSKYIQGFKKIMIVASPNVQENFKLQLFNPSSLKKVNGIWNISGCLGNSFIEELNISQINDLEKEVLIQKINKIISNHYIFLGYVELANIIEKLYNMKHKQKVLTNYFKGRVIVIDEIHNIRLTSDSDKAKKKVAMMLKMLVQTVKYIRFIFLTGTPMYNDPKEIIFILNILNANDNRSLLTIGEVFDANGELKVKDGANGVVEIGKQKLILKANGYVSYVRGENPYAFPFLVTPKMYNDPQSIKSLPQYPERQFNNNKITNGIQHLDLYLHKMSETQEEGYDAFIDQITSELSEEELERFEEMDSVQYTMVMKPIQALNINYKISSKEGDKYYVGKEGLKQVMRFKESANPPSKNNFEYKSNVGMFQYDKIGVYSVKIKSILDHIINSNGIVLVYSQYIDGGLVPMALALEELGMKRYTNKNLFKTAPNEPLNVYNMKRDPSLFTGDNFKHASYAIICGDKKLSPNNKEEVEALTHNNMNGERVKVVLISQAGSEGIDLNYLRQVHIMEPWYNMNRIEQIIGRARRNCSHKDLELKYRNVQLFLHATLLDKIESMDMFLYRKSEIKSVKIGKVSKLLKSVAVDCILNKQQQAFSKMTEVVKIQLSNSNEIDYEVKDQPFTSLCDYSETCEFQCINKPGIIKDKKTYTYESAKNSKIVDRIKELFTMKHIYHEDEFINLLRVKGKGIEIERAIYDMLNDKELLIDKFGRKGTLVNINNLYLFQPIEIQDKHVSIYERMNPIAYKPKLIEMEDQEDQSQGEAHGQDEEKGEDEVKPKSKRSNFMEKLMKYYDKAKQGLNEDGWYDHYYETLKLLKIYLSDQDKDILLIFHICESFSFEEDLQAIELFVKDDVSDIEDIVKKYYEQYIVQKDDITGILLMNYALKDPLQIYVLNERSGSNAGKWIPATYEEKGILSKEIKKKLIMNDALFKWVGYMGNYKGSFDFKIINTEANTDKEKFTSSVFENKGRPEMYKILNETVDESFTYNKSTADVKKIQLAILEEIYLRIYNKQNEERFFLNKLEVYIVNKKLR